MKTIKPITIHGWQGFVLEHDDLRLVLAPSIGGRIISLVYQNKELLFVQNEHAGEVFYELADDVIAQKKKMGFRVWGGDKTWIAPQQQWVAQIPPLDLDAGVYQLSWDQQTAVMTSPICRETGIQIVRRVCLGPSGVCLEEEIFNRNAYPITKGIWNVTQVVRPCVFYIPSMKDKIRSYHHEDPTLPPVDENFKQTTLGLEIRAEASNLFKYGGMPQEGKVFIMFDDSILWTREFDIEPKEPYAHHSAVEMFNSAEFNYAEIEIHSPLKEIQPQGSMLLRQQWRFLTLAPLSNPL